MSKAGEWVESGKAWPPLIHRDDSPCSIGGRPIPPSNHSDRVFVIARGKPGIDRAFRQDGGQPNWFIHGDAVLKDARQQAMVEHGISTKSARLSRYPWPWPIRRHQECVLNAPIVVHGKSEWRFDEGVPTDERRNL